MDIISSRFGTSPFLREPPPFSGYPLILKEIKKVTPLFLVLEAYHPILIFIVKVLGSAILLYVTPD